MCRAQCCSQALTVVMGVGKGGLTFHLSPDLPEKIPTVLYASLRPELLKDLERA